MENLQPLMTCLEGEKARKVTEEVMRLSTWNQARMEFRTIRSFQLRFRQTIVPDRQTEPCT
ncbi:hypothetical protein F2Q69_00020672 [Brassica cretica]|uniref:Uncharacterized protein n=1 Tax=Brassica cretica TaxID=69181 RepID=A0A8S9QPJ6_BRACR|nr:hypothetical protein F2Q69_00020672 [Brassica cretica]